ncbi:MAG TPA: ABC transporter ATP-binding protein [Tenuifilaceae bacterium]|nr:ABC transporter ATP-binding protein [Tenuifilaceae bacterium]
MSQSLLNIKELSIGYESQRALYPEITEQAHSAELIALVGRNGVGKSTLLRSLAGLQHPLEGSIEVDGVNLNSISRSEKARLISFVPSEQVKIQNLSIRSFVGLARFPYAGWGGGLSKHDWSIVDSALSSVGISNLSARDISLVSDGERHRAMIAFAIAQDTRVILLDEPTAFLDLPNKFETVRLLSQIASENSKTVIYSTHDLQGAIHEADSIWMMLPDGMVSGSPEDLALSESFQKLLVNTDVTFDMDTGTFKNKPSGSEQVYVTGEGLQLFWTVKMLQRIGYSATTTDSAGKRIVCSKTSSSLMWDLEVDGEPKLQFSTLKNLAERLKNNVKKCVS